MKRYLLEIVTGIILALTVAVLLPLNAEAATRTEQKTYTGGLDVLILDCDNNIGGVCFDLLGNEATAVVTFDDESGQPVGGIYEFRNVDDETIASGVFCSSFTAKVPDRSSRLLVFLAAATGPVDCLENGGTGVATTGSVTGTFRLKGSTNEQTVYELPRWFEWNRVPLDVLIIPPNHGQIVNDDGVLSGGDPNELDPLTNSYLRAMEDSINAWKNGILAYGSSWLAMGLQINVYVVGRDNIPQQVLAEPEIVITTDETKGPILGFAFSSDPCWVNNSKLFVTSMTYADMYNINGQEVGHCFGLLHTSDHRPDHDVMDGTYDDTPGASGTHLHCVSNLDVFGLEQVFGALFGKTTEEIVSIRPQQYKTIACSYQNPTGASQ
ncbi:hypothetical protein L0222_21085 [bacterium]|nr:hypothetical protein [bacterium]MCI0603735.1 hypothetical protein [bacterium]